VLVGLDPLLFRIQRGLFDKPKILVNWDPITNSKNYQRTQVFSAMDVILGAYGDVGRDEFGDGEPSPDIPDTEYLLLPEVGTAGRGGTGGSPLLNTCRCELELEFVRAGGVVGPFKVEVDDLVVEALPFVLLEAPLESVDLSVLKLAFDRLRRSFRNEGAIFTVQDEQSR